jgi:hypothetical protein
MYTQDNEGEVEVNKPICNSRGGRNVDGNIAGVFF